MPTLRAGDAVKNGEFIVESLLGVGGFGEVYRASQLSIRREVAIKVVRPDLAGDAHVLALFEREARAAGSLLHPHVLPVIDFGFDADLRIHFLVMPYVRGGVTLKDRLKRPLPLPEAVRLIEAVGSALDAAHRRGITHRDVKPANVLLDEDERPLLADFGIARLDTATAGSATGIHMGTALYMAPERWFGEPADAKSDQYALAVMAYEMIGGRPPFEGDTVALMGQHLNRTPASLATLNPAVTYSVEQAVLRGMMKKPAERFGSCREFTQALASAAGATSGPVLGDRDENAWDSVQGRQAETALTQQESNQQDPPVHDMDTQVDPIPRGSPERNFLSPAESMDADVGYLGIKEFVQEEAQGGRETATTPEAAVAESRQRLKSGGIVWIVPAVLVLGLVFLGGREIPRLVLEREGASTPTQTVETSQVAPIGIPTASQEIPATPATAPSRPSMTMTVRAAATNIAVPTEFVRVANTGGTGAFIRREPRNGAPGIIAHRDGTVLRIVGPDTTTDGRPWRQVEDQRGNRGWTPREYLAASPTGF